MARIRSWAFVLGTLLSGAMLAACDGSSDGGVTASPVAANAVMLSWEAPTENTDGTLLSDLSGYTIHYGTEPQSYTNTIEITNPGLTDYLVDSLSPGTYYFAITASASDGLQSAYSPEVSATVN